MEIPVYEAEESPCRAYVIQRRTKETRISVDLCLEGGEIRISTGIGFFDHMLTAFAFYGGSEPGPGGSEGAPPLRLRLYPNGRGPVLHGSGLF